MSRSGMLLEILFLFKINETELKAANGRPRTEFLMTCLTLFIEQRKWAKLFGYRQSRNVILFCVMQFTRCALYVQTTELRAVLGTVQCLCESPT